MNVWEQRLGNVWVNVWGNVWGTFWDSDFCGSVWRGMHITELTPEETAKLGASLRVSRVRKGSPADRAGFYEGALLDEFKSSELSAIVKLTSLDQLRKLAGPASNAVYLHSPLLGYVQVNAE